MIIELQEPFKSIWKSGYLVVNSENRRNVLLRGFSSEVTTISYARYLVCVKLGYILSSEYEVDHIDNDKTNDDISNLQVLTKRENKRKQELWYEENEMISYGLVCAQCGMSFLLSRSQMTPRLSQNVEYAFCSRSCASKHQHLRGAISLLKAPISEDLQKQIKDLRNQCLSSYKISEITGCARNTVMKYWK